MRCLNRFTIVCAVFLSCQAMPVMAETTVYYRAGNWNAFTTRGDQGSPACGIFSTDPSDGRGLSLRFDIGGEDTTFTATKPAWQIPAGTAVRVVMQVGLETPWIEQARGHDHGIAWTLDRAAIQTFDKQFRRAGSMTLTFPDGNERPWTISLSGSTAISNAFGRCITDLTRQTETAAPSAAGSAATQPFGAAPASPTPDATTAPASPAAPLEPQAVPVR
ncbi:MAG TPA: hypothetical protein VN702_19230 [Acetobacteraceae bacterium]|nr:hypothetical protein [Acetobacteraceae bacterium]